MSTFATLWRTWISTSVHHLFSRTPSLPHTAFRTSLSSSPHHPQAACWPPPWNRPAASRRPAGARPQRGPRVNLLNWRANWRLSLRGRFWLRSWGNQIESSPGYSVPPSIEMDAASRCILAPRQVATELAVEGACGPHVTSTSVFVVKMDGRVRGWWRGTSECTIIITRLMVRFGVGMGRANSEFVNVQQRQDSRSPPSNVKVTGKQRQEHQQAASRLSSSHLKVTIKHRQEPPWNRRIVSGRCAGARPHRGPRVNLLEFGEGQLACFLSRCPP
ncbi:hypothetical protein EV121DRAFT_282595 [Schizophyllum commune]